MRLHRLTFALAIGAAGGVTTLYALLTRARRRMSQPGTPAVRISRHTIVSGGSVLDAVYAEPTSVPIRCVLLICHGIGEIVDRWLPVQRLLAANGAASMVFDYSGYGRSRGRVTAAQFEDDAVAAFRHLQTLAPNEPAALLGFSLGTGVAAAAICRTDAHRLVLCAGFPSFEAAAWSFGIPRWWKRLVPPIWRIEESLRGCSIPILVVHGENDRMFPLKLGKELHAGCGAGAKLHIAPLYGHNEPFRDPRLEYWGPIMDWLAGDRTTEAVELQTSLSGAQRARDTL
jgi:pimeloyl-ACP methyl ester carboxylesterase